MDRLRNYLNQIKIIKLRDNYLLLLINFLIILYLSFIMISITKMMNRIEKLTKVVQEIKTDQLPLENVLLSVDMRGNIFNKRVRLLLDLPEDFKLVMIEPKEIEEIPEIHTCIPVM